MLASMAQLHSIYMMNIYKINWLIMPLSMPKRLDLYHVMRSMLVKIECDDSPLQKGNFK